MRVLLVSSLALLIVCSFALPHDRQKRATSCTLTGSSISDLSSIKKSCTSITIKDLSVPAGKTLDLTGLTKGTTVTFKGKITFGYKEWEGPLIAVSGTSIKIVGASGNKLDGQGSKYWDGKGGNGGKTKPKFFKATKLYDSTISGLNIYNSPKHVFSIDSSKNVVISDILIDDSAGKSKGHNTDGFDIGNSEHITIKSSKVYNQDDCLAINSGSYITFSNNYCSGGHGISIGSVGGRSNNVVEHVEVKNCEVVDSDNGIRIKTVAGKTGTVDHISFTDITLKNIQKYGIDIQGDYTNSGSTGTPTSGVPIKNLTVKNVKGTVASSGHNIYVLVKGASNWTWSGVSITGGKTAKCSGIPSGSGASC